MELSHCPSFILDRIDASVIRRQIKNEIRQIVKCCWDEERASSVYRYCQIKGTSSEDYKYRIQETPLGKMITSIRFVGGDLTKPAVFIVLAEFELNERSAITEIARLISREYKTFKPQRMRWYSVEGQDALIRDNVFIRGDMVDVAGFIDELKANPKPFNSENVVLEHCTSTKWYAEYKSEYEYLQQQWPEFTEMGQLETLASLEDLKAKDLLFEIMINDQWAGIIAADRGEDRFLKGYMLVEEFLIKQFRGQRYGPAIQRQLIERLNHESNELLFGTIHYDNRPSLRTAFRIGRKQIGMHLFADLI